jgi:hypothetical protein
MPVVIHKRLGPAWFVLGIAAIIGAVVVLPNRHDAVTLGAFAFVLLICVYMVIRTLRQSFTPGRMPNEHYPDVCEGCHPIRMTAGGPITDLVKWYAAVKHISREKAEEWLMDPAKFDDATKGHEAYLQQHFPNHSQR